MSLDNAAHGFSIDGVYHVHRRSRTRIERSPRCTVIVYRIKGKSSYTCGGEEIVADAGSMICIPAGGDCTIRRSGEEEMIAVHLECFGEDSEKLEIYGGSPELEALFRQLSDEWSYCDAEWRHNRCMSILYAILEKAQKMKRQSGEGVPEVISPGVEMMHSAFQNPELSVFMLADACHISEVYFRRIYKKHFGISPIEGLLALRFAYAESLLKSGYYSVKEVASLSGFADVKYFRTTFTRRMGRSPSEYLHSDGENDA